MLKSVIVTAGLMAGGVFLTSAASASEIGAGLAPETADLIQPAHVGWGGYGGWGRGYGRGYWRPHYGWGYGGYHRHRHHGWGGGWGRGYGGGWGYGGGRGYF